MFLLTCLLIFSTALNMIFFVILADGLDKIANYIIASLKENN